MLHRHVAVRRAPHRNGAEPKDGWDKAKIILRPIGPLAAAGIAAYLGFLTSDFLDRQQRVAASVELYAQLMSSREAADSALRKEMFNTTLGAFLTSVKRDTPEERVLKLELLARNFHNSLDLAPLFEHLYRQLGQAGELKARLERLAQQVDQQQLAALEAVGARRDGAIDLNDLPKQGRTVLDAVSLRLPGAAVGRMFSVEVLRAYPEQRKLRCRLIVRDSDGREEVDSVLDVGIFDFPMIRNVPLPGGDRCALVVTKLRSFSAEITLAYFPASRAALKEKPYYDEILRQLVAGAETLDGDEDHATYQ